MTDMDIELEIQKLRDRLHKIADMLQVHEVKLSEHYVRIEMQHQQIDGLANRTATREQLDSAILSIGLKLTNAVETMTLKIANVHDDLDPIRKGIYWTVTLILGAVVLAGLAFILKRPGS